MSKFYSLTKSVNSIPLKWYYDLNHFEKEQSKIFNKEWIYVCHENNLKESLSYLTIKVSKVDILILKDKLNVLKAYLNTCRHRGSVICSNQNGKLKNNILICPYHQWSYNASDGKLLKTSSFKIPKNFKISNYGLKKINIKIWNGLIFINLDKKIKWKIKNRFQDYNEIVNKLGIEKYEVAHRWKKIIKCNWKLFWENYSECLHCPNIHPDLTKLVPVYGRRMVDIKDDPNWKKLKKIDHPKFQGGLRKGAETWSLDGSAHGKKIKEVEQSRNFQGFIYITTWPTMFLVIFIDHIRVVRILPKTNSETEVSAEWLFPSDTLKDKNYKIKNVVDFSVKVMSEDSHACELNQQGVYNPAYKTGILMPEEYEIKRFHDWLRKKIKILK